MAALGDAVSTITGTGRDANGAVYVSPPPRPVAEGSLIVLSPNGGMRG